MEKYELAELDYKNGMKYKDIADKYEVSLNTVKSWKQRYKWCKDIKKVCTQNPEKYAHKIDESNASKKEVKEEIIETLVDNELTDKQRLFCIYYMQSFNATKAATKAGYSRETAYQIGFENLRKPEIKKYLTELKEMYAQDDYMETKRILERHKQIAFSDVKDFTEFQVEKVFIEYDKETEEPIFDKRFQFRIKDDVEVDGTLIKKIGMGKFGPVIELEDRAKSLDFLSKVYGLDPSFKNQIEKLEIERNKVKSMDDRNRILENANKPPSSRVEDMTEHELDNYLKKYGGA
ncbi:MAG: terminase small subunit [Cetobacterium sp.]|uniref:terminase small subunit n=1 Tax=Cetobacterium sp. TaxID=2071632 RepID=UPI003EE671D5